MCPAPLHQNILLPRGQTSARYAPSALAQLILNMEVTADGTLRSVAGPTLYEPKHLSDWSGSPTDFGDMYAIHHAMVFGGTAEMLLVAAGGRLYAHRRNGDTWQNLVAGVRDDRDAMFPPQMVTFGNYVIYCDGFVRPKLIDMNYMTMDLGFTETPSPPDFEGPANPPASLRNRYAPGSFGYCFPGGLGTPGDKLSGADSGTLRGRWKVCAVYEDPFGNRSASSELSERVAFGPLRALDNRGGDPTGTSVSESNQLGTTVSDLQRGARVRLSGTAPENALKVLIYQTGDMRNSDPTPRLAYESHAVNGVIHGGWADGDLGAPVQRNRPVPIFHCMTVHQGCLVVAEHEKVYRSAPGFPGTFPEANVAIADDESLTVTALATFNDRCIAFTRRSLIDVTDIAAPRVISKGAGCVGPSAVGIIPGLGLVFVGEAAVYAYDGTAITVLSSDIERLFKFGINRTALSRAVVWYDPESKDLRIACARLSDSYNRKILCYRADSGWRELSLGLHIADVTVTEGPRSLQLVAGDDFQSRTGEYTSSDVYVLDRETSVYTPNSRVSRIRTVPMMFSEDMVQKGRLIHMVVGFIETYQGAACTIRVRTNFEDDYRYDSQVLRLDDVYGKGATTTNSSRVVGWDVVQVGNSSTVPRRRTTYRRITLDMDDVRRFQIELETSYPVDMEIMSIHVGYEVKTDEQMRYPGAGEV
jgi:hypothetical protein